MILLPSLQMRGIIGDHGANRTRDLQFRKLRFDLSCKSSRFNVYEDLVNSSSRLWTFSLARKVIKKHDETLSITPDLWDKSGKLSTRFSFLKFTSRQHQDKPGGFSMAKRFTDTKKWDKGSFGELSMKMKLVWIYLCDNCDHAGFWDINLRLLSFQIGEAVTIDELKSTFPEALEFVSSKKILVKDFIEFQYGELNPDNRAHRSVLNLLKKEGAKKGLTRSLEAHKDKDKDKDKEKEGECEGISKSDLEAVYREYPRKDGKTPGMKTAKAQIKTFEDLEQLRTSIENYKAKLKRDGTAKEFVLHFSTFMNQWRDWLDPSHGSAEDFSKEKSKGDFAFLYETKDPA